MIVLDTTILIYAVGADHPLRSPCREIIESVRDGDVRATTTVEVLQELAHVRARRRGRNDAASLARSYCEGLRPLLRPDDDDALAGFELFRRSSVLGAFDAVLAATAIRREMPLASADRAFRRVKGLSHLDPAAAHFLDRARATR